MIPARLLVVVLIINHQGRPAACVTAGRVQLYPRIGALEPDHPVRRWVICSALFGMEVLAGHMPGRYTQTRADLFARCALIPDNEFEPLWANDDAALAEYFNVPLEQVYEKRVDLLALAAGGPVE